MADVKLGDLIALVLGDLADTLEQNADRSGALGLQIGDVDLDIPAYLRLPSDPPVDPEPARLMITLPSTRETPVVGQLGRVRLRIEASRLANGGPL
jgi:hypothetical protein